MHDELDSVVNEGVKTLDCEDVDVSIVVRSEHHAVVSEQTLVEGYIHNGSLCCSSLCERKSIIFGESVKSVYFPIFNGSGLTSELWLLVLKRFKSSHLLKSRLSQCTLSRRFVAAHINRHTSLIS